MVMSRRAASRCSIAGNVMCLDVLRVLERSPDTVRRVLEDIDELGRSEPRLMVALDRIEKLLAEAMRDQSVARALVEQLALAQAAALLLAHAPGAVSDAFLATRLGGAWRSTYGTGGAAIDTRAILDYAAPLV